MNAKTYESAVYCEQANWLTHVEFKTDQSSLNHADRLFIRRHHREMNRGYIFH